MSWAGNDDLIEVERRCFAETGNPMHVWAAYRLARVVDAPIPEWVLRYLDRSGDNLLQISSEAGQSGGKDLGPKIAKALGLASKGRGSPLVRYHADWMVFGANVRARISHGDKPYLAVEAIAFEAGVAKSTVQDAWTLFDALFPGASPMPDEAL